MSAYDEFAQEKQEIDVLLEQGYSIVGVWEGLDGTGVQFEQAGTAPNRKELHLLTADARKYVSGVISDMQISRQAAG